MGMRLALTTALGSLPVFPFANIKSQENEDSHGSPSNRKNNINLGKQCSCHGLHVAIVELGTQS